MKISANITAFNEEANIARCLKSLSFADEIIVTLDSRTTDQTEKIARKFTSRVYKKTFSGFSDIKQFCLSKSKYEWVFVIDADEEVSPALAEEIKSKIKNTVVPGYVIKRDTFFLGRQIKHCGWGKDYQLRLFKKKSGGYDGRTIHESIKLNGAPGRIDAPLYHYSYPDSTSYFSKLNTYTTLQAEAKQKKFLLLRMVLSPFIKFFRMYFLKAGFADGLQGFILCVYSGFSEFVKFSKMWEERKKGKGQGILLRSPNWIGDAVMFTAMIKPAKMLFKKVVVLSDKGGAPVFENNPDIDKLIVFDKNDSASVKAAVTAVKKENVNCAAAFTPSLSSGIMLKRASIKKRAGFAEDGLFLNLRYKRDKKHAALHITEEFKQILYLLSPSFDFSAARQEIFTDSSEEKAALHKFGILKNTKYCVLAPFVMYGPAKMWPLDRWADLARALLKRHRGLKIALAGTPMDREFEFSVDDKRIIDLRGRTNLKEITAVIKNGLFFAGNDSGLMHIADGLNVPLLAIFGSTSYQWTGPLSEKSRVISSDIDCSPCFEKQCRYGHYDCLKKIKVSDVLKEAERLQLGIKKFKL
ncbi:MAG: lipopolysaccharide heptosyltransferase II [Candidatus Goldiibacteriota bacterium HGW-Goldbacteria-1]|jgi:lipopolysaccharide heptosyltransferase II|nr:MAG: lipopolysaccharide heptosyltransferase II [Candidatus Goldiibacteriota bacterium HGW-Goldbacteria-1]